MTKSIVRLLYQALGPRPFGGAAPPLPHAGVMVSEHQRETIRPHFDPAFYLKSNVDVAAAGVDPLEHFLTYGWREGRDPNAHFDIGHYLLANSDVDAAGINPFYHYIVAGKDEGRTPYRKHRWRRDAVMSAAPLARPTVKWRVEPGTSQHTLRQLRDATAKAKSIVLSFSHDLYTVTPGGVQNCIADEQRRVNAEGNAYIHLAPQPPFQTLSPATKPDAIDLHVTVDGETIGTVVGSDLREHLSSDPRAAGARLVVHHLLGHSPEVIADIAHTINATTYYWTHDFFSLCEGWALLRNNLAFCGAPPIDSPACMICIHGGRREEHAARVARFISATRAEIIAPSQSALDLLKRGGLDALNTRVVPHGHIVFANERPRQDVTLPLKVAFVGLPVTHKGWPAFVELARSCRASSSYDFIQIGSRAGQSPDIRYFALSVTPADREAMVRELVEQEIDIVVNWTLCHETFSFVTHEAIAAGTFVIVPVWAGHAARVVANERAGWVAPDLETLFDEFETGEILERYQARRAAGLRRGTFVPSGGNGGKPASPTHLGETAG